MNIHQGCFFIPCSKSKANLHLKMSKWPTEGLNFLWVCFACLLFICLFLFSFFLLFCCFPSDLFLQCCLITCSLQKQPVHFHSSHLWLWRISVGDKWIFQGFYKLGSCRFLACHSERLRSVCESRLTANKLTLPLMERWPPQRFVHPKKKSSYLEHEESWRCSREIMNHGCNIH